MSNPNPIRPIVYLKQNLCRWLARCWPPSKLKVWKVPVPDSEKKYCVQPEGALLSKSQVYWDTWKFERIDMHRAEVYSIEFFMHDNMVFEIACQIHFTLISHCLIVDDDWVPITNVRSLQRAEESTYTEE